MPFPTRRARISLAFAVAALAAVSLCGAIGKAEESAGAVVYREKCASCHGANGEGVKDEYANPLLGDRSLKELSKYIDEKMPAGEPEAVSAEDSARVAEYIYDAFYSPTAQFRNKPARIELSHLTVRQYRHAVCDIITGFTGRGEWNDERGLKAEYFNSRRPRENRRVIERIDAVVKFDYGDKSPETEMIPDPAEFSASWEGSVIAPDDGEYEFIVETENATRLFINDRRTPVIDASVKSGDQKVFRASVPLLGGRAYRLELEHIKSKPEKTASIALKWKRPGHADELIPSRFLWPQQPPERLVIATPFPPDDRSMGYERGTSVSKEWDEATTYAALEAAEWISARCDRLADTQPDQSDRPQKLREFSRKFAERAFRRPLTDEQRQKYVDRQFDEAGDPILAIKRVVLATLKSPRFLYRDLAEGPDDGYAIASRLSFALWDSLPDDPLLNAAGQGQLIQRDQVQAQVDRMLNDKRTLSKLREFFEMWLRIDHFGDLAKDGAAYPGFTPELISDLRTSLELTLDDIVVSDTSDFRRLFTTDEMYFNGPLAAFYGIELPADSDFQKVAVSKDQRIGILTHPYLLAGFAYHASSSPIHRGVFLSRSILGRALRPPPVAVAPLAPDLHADLTTRERVILQTSPDMCQSCHGMINSLGFSLEHFDAVGRYRQEEKSRPIDASGSYFARSGETVPFQDVRQLATFLADGPETSAAFAQQLFQFAVKQPLRAYGAGQPEALQQRFAGVGFHLRKFFGEVAMTAAVDVPAPPPAGLSRTKP